MRVTDEMVEAFANVYHFRGQTYTPDLVRAALEAAISRAAGQEAVAEVSRDGSIIWLALRPLKAGIKLYTHPRTCPSGEVEREAARYRFLRDDDGDGYKIIAHNGGPEDCDARIDAAMAASSEVKGEGDAK